MASMSLQVVYDQARQALESNDVERAIGLAQHILDHYPDNLEAYRILGEAYLANRQLDRAQESFQRVLRSDPENIPAHVGLGITSERQGQLDRAIGEFEQALEIKPDMTELRSQLLRLYAEGWGSENAQLRLSRAGLARLYAKGHMLPQAIAEFRQVLNDQPGRHDAMVALAEALWRDGQEEDAADLCRDILVERPESLKANLLLGYLLLSSGRPEGERYWQVAQRMDPYQSVAHALFETLPQDEGEQPAIEAWDEAAWRARRAAEQQEQLAATRPMEAVTPVGTLAASAMADAPVERVSAGGASAGGSSFADADDFLASLLSMDMPSTPPPIPPVDIAEKDIDLDLDLDTQIFSFEELSRPASATPPAEPAAPASEEPAMAPFSLSDLGLSEDEIAGLESASAAPTAPAEPASEEPAMTPFSLSDLGLSEDEIAGLESASAAPAAPGEPASEEPEMAPFSLSDLGLSEDEIAGLESASAAPAEPAAPGEPASEEPAMTPFSLSDLGLSEDEIAGLESASAAPAAPGEPASEEPAMTPFSLSDLGLSEDEIAGLESASAAPTMPRADEPKLAPFSLSDLGLSEDEIAGLESLQSTPKPPAPEPPAAPPEDLVGQEDLPVDLQPFSIDEFDLGDDTRAGVSGLPPSLQPFSLDEPPPQRPRVSGFSSAESSESEAAEDEEFTPETRGFSWQQASQKPQPDFTKSLRPDTSGEEASIFAKLRQQRQSQGEPPPPPLPPVSLSEDEHLGLFSMDDVPLREDAGTVDAAAAPAAESAPETSPEAAAAPQEIEDLQSAVERGQVQPFSLADLGLSPEEIAALEGAGLTEPGAPAAEPSPEIAPEPAAPQEIEDLQSAVERGQVQPFSLADLGLSPEEIAALEGAGLTEPGAPAAEPSPEIAPEPAAPQEIEDLQSAVERGQVQPFSLADLGLSPEEIAAIEGTPAEPADAAPEQPAEPPVLEAPLETSPAPAPAAGEEEPLMIGDLQPFSLADLGLSDEEISALGLGSSEQEEEGEVGLGLTEEELEGLDGGDLKWLQTPAAPAAPPQSEEPPAQVTSGDLVVDRLIALGRQQGYVDISDIIANVDDPEAETERIEEIGRLLHEARVEIRDGDEVIDMEADYAEEAEAGEPAEPTEETPERPSAPARELDLLAEDLEAPAPRQPETPEPDMTPFSLSELGLSDEEINALGLGEMPAPAQPDEQAAEPSAEEPDMTPFSLSELGLSDEEIAALGLSGAPEPARPAEPAAKPLAEEPDITPFSLSELGLSDEEIATLGLGDMPAPAEEPAAPAPPEAAAPQPTPVEPPRMPPAPEAVVSQPTPVEPPSVPRAPEAAPPVRPPAPIAAEAAGTGSSLLDAFIRQLEAEPQNDVLRLSVARVGGQIGQIELAVSQYKYLIKHSRLLGDIVQELQELIEYSDDRQSLQRLHRLLGDAYSKQGRLQEAIEEYSWRG